MSVQIPNVLCIKTINSMEDINFDSYSITLKINPLPNMKAKKLYYLFKNDRLYHIRSYMINKDNIILKLGNTFQVKQKPNITKDIEYIRLSDFGYQQLEPGCLIEIKN